MKRFLFGFIMALMVFGMTSCGFAHDEYAEMELTEKDIKSVGQSPIPVASGSSVNEIKTISIYTVDSIAQELVPVKIRVDAERITPEYIVEEVLRNLDEKVEVTLIEVSDRRLYVVFDDKYAPVSECSPAFETLILDCISNSLLDNISYIDEIVFRCSDGAYKSDNFSFGKNEVYSSK